jgi:hypothetical protein
MLDVEKQAVLKVINDLWAHDAWNWGNTCASLVNHEINFDAPAIVDIDGEYITANVYVKDGREFQIGYQEGGWWMCFIKDSSDPRARLTKRAPDVCHECGESETIDPNNDGVPTCVHCGTRR